MAAAAADAADDDDDDDDDDAGVSAAVTLRTTWLVRARVGVKWRVKPNKYANWYAMKAPSWVRCRNG